QPPLEHASQQLDTAPTHALPPAGARHRSAFRLMLHRVWPLASVRQHVTYPSRPQVERLAHETSWLRHASRTVPSRTTRLAAWAMHATYAPWLSADAQSHSAAMAARAADVASASPLSVPQGAPLPSSWPPLPLP